VEREGPRVVCYIHPVFSYALCVSLCISVYLCVSLSVSLSVSLLVVCVFFVVCLGRFFISLSYRFDRFYICVVVVVVPLYLFSRGRPSVVVFFYLVSRTFLRTVSSVFHPLKYLSIRGLVVRVCGIKWYEMSTVASTSDFHA
jgi:hypothetical protein